MPRWVPLKREKILHNPYQQAFWTARRARQCKVCLHVFECPPSPFCPKCEGPSIRLFNRLTIIAGRRGGKTLGGAVAAAEEASIPDTIGWACAPTNPKLHRYVIPAFQQIIPPEWVDSWNSEYNDLRLKNGALIHFQTLEDPNQGRGQGLDWLWIDEVCELTHLHWLTIEPSLTERRGGAFFTTSPQSYDWVYKELYKPAEEKTPGYWAVKYRTRDNPIIDNAEVEAAKRRMPDAMFRQEYEADFVIFQGAVFGNAIEGQILRGNAVRDFIPEWPALNASRSVLIGLDAGADHPFGAVKIVSTELGLVVVGEYLERHRTVAQHATTLKNLANSANVRWAINKNDPQIALELAQHGIFCSMAENDVVGGIGRVQSWLHNRQLFFVEANCPRTVEQMRAYRWADNYSSKGEKMERERVYKRDDELPDALRYALMTWPVLPKSAVPDTSIRPLIEIPEQQRWVTERLRRIDGRVKEPDTVVGDFWG